MKKQDRLERAWRMRNDLGWSLERIASNLGIGKSAVCRLLARAAQKRGLTLARRTPKPKTRAVRAIPLSMTFFT